MMQGPAHSARQPGEARSARADGAPNWQTAVRGAGALLGLVARFAQLAVDGARRDAEKLRGQRFVAVGVAEGLADETALDLVERRADGEAERAGRWRGGLRDHVRQIFGNERVAAAKNGGAF